jgi:PAS domain S-box-containing protein
MAAEGHPRAPDELTRLRLLIEHSTDMLARHAPDGRYRYVSPAARQLLGIEPSELVGRSPYERIHPDDVADVRESHEAILRQPHLRAVAYRMRRHDDAYVWLETTGHAIRGEGGELLELQTSSRDVSWRKQAEAQLADSEQRFRLAMANAPIGMALVGLDGTWIEVNDSLCEILARPRDELLGLTFQDVTHPEDLDTDLGYATQLLEGAIPHYQMEKRYLRPSGEIVWALLSGSLVRDEKGEPSYFIAQVGDITARKRALLELERAGRELERSNAELRRYASVVAHDLRSPLATVSGFLELLDHRYAGQLDPQGVQILRITRRVTTQMAESVETLLALSQAETDELTREVVDAGEVVEEVADAVGATLRSGETRLRVGALPRVRVDRTQLRLLFQNLLINAVKFREPARPLVVEVDAERCPEGWRFTVTDNGRGLGRRDPREIFEPFTRTSESHNLSGTGIGLATCRRIIERHGGTISAHAAEPGLCIEFVLPDPPPTATGEPGHDRVAR